MHSMDVYNQVKITEVAGSTQSKKYIISNRLACGVNGWVYSHLTTKIS